MNRHRRCTPSRSRSVPEARVVRHRPLAQLCPWLAASVSVVRQEIRVLVTEE